MYSKNNFDLSGLTFFIHRSIGILRLQFIHPENIKVQRKLADKSQSTQQWQKQWQ